MVARFRDSKDPEPLGVWVYQGGALRTAEIEKLDQALGADRGLWPPYTLLFATVPEGKNKLRLDLMVRYDMGLLPDSRGGSSSTWQLERRKGRWVLVGEAVTMNITDAGRVGIRVAAFGADRGMVKIEDALGQIEDAPFNTEHAPFEIESALLQKEDAPFKKDDALGQIEHAPLQIESAPCPHELAPGQIAYAPGQVAYALRQIA